MGSDSETLIKKLRKKAELCRYCHSELGEKHEKRKRYKDFSIVILSMLSTLFVGLSYRGFLSNECALMAVFIVSLIVALVQTLDHIVFDWTSRVLQHERAIQIWGSWIRKADFIEKNICQYANEIAHEKINHIQERYSDCMSNTPHIPNRDFLKYKRDFREYRLNSERIDAITIEDIENEKKNK